jgi:hypothetical protein
MPVTSPTGNVQVIYRGTTAQFATTFYDVAGNVVQPAGATINIVCLVAAGNAQQTIDIPMVAPVPPSVAWTAYWDTRNIGAGPVQFSVHTTNPTLPDCVEDGNFILSANAANLISF